VDGRVFVEIALLQHPQQQPLGRQNGIVAHYQLSLTPTRTLVGGVRITASP
jgi:hypothetical protein